MKSLIMEPMEEAKEIEVIESSRKRKGIYPPGTVIQFL